MSRRCVDPARSFGLLSCVVPRALPLRSCSHGLLRSTTQHRSAFYERIYAISTATKIRSTPRKSLPSPANATSVGPLIRNFQTSIPTYARSNRGRPRPKEQSIRVPFKDIDLEELHRIFRYDVGYREGNIILRVLHERRVNGSLIDLGVRIDGATDIPQSATNSALEWLREEFPVDEQAAAQNWAKLELEKLEMGYINRAERLGLYKAEPGESRSPRSTADTSTSVIDEFKRYHEQRREVAAQERKDSGMEQKEQELQLAKQDEASRKKEIWDAKLAERREQLAKQGMIQIPGRDLEDTSIPELTKTRRLLPATLFGAACLVAFYFLAQNYTPPTRNQRLFPDVPVSISTLGGIVGLNLLVFCLWRVPPCQAALNKFFMAVPAYPYAISIMGIPDSKVSLRRLKIRESQLTQHRKPQSSTEDYSFAMDVSRYLVATMNFLSQFAPGTMSKVDVIAHGAGALTGLFGAHVWREQHLKEAEPPEPYHNNLERHESLRDTT
ncbi:hypothetical protein FH972_025063 [Carpinus fangiana]|uniref:Peptidase S54 rhomboid domain-containing protein n=1 Tax=Carpinus fangiana TaxID=176857 RepID=A0A5N6L2F5_9ROSI|nr:hypothetical protein FH972_025063 [Carpinus fangiana]